MFFSVIVPVYNVEKYIDACVESVLSQSFEDFELILVDDGSPDRCPEICDSYAASDSRVKVIHKANGGLAAARQSGMEVAGGEYVFNLDSDDAIEPDTLIEAYNIISTSDCDIVSFGYQWVENSRTVDITTDGLKEGLYTGDEIKKHIFPRLLMNKNMEHMSYYLSGKAVRRELLKPIQLEVNPGISLGEDLCCVIPCYLRAKSVYISSKNAYLYTVRMNSMSKKFNAEQINLVENIIGEITTDELKAIDDFYGQLCRYSAFMCFAILASAAEGNHFKSLGQIKDKIVNSAHMERIKNASFEAITPKSRIALFLMKKKCFAAAFVFLNISKNIRKILKRR